MNYIYH